LIWSSLALKDLAAKTKPSGLGAFSPEGFVSSARGFILAETGFVLPFFVVYKHMVVPSSPRVYHPKNPR
jgi:hypothetical protein